MQSEVYDHGAFSLVFLFKYTYIFVSVPNFYFTAFSLNFGSYYQTIVFIANFVGLYVKKDT